MKQNTIIILLAVVAVLYLLFRRPTTTLTAAGVPIGGGSSNGLTPVYGSSASALGIGSILSGAGNLVASLTKAFQGSPAPSPAPQPSYAPVPTSYANAPNYSAITDQYGNIIS